MGRRTFLFWVDQANRELERQRAGRTDTWAGSAESANWQNLRASRDKARGYVPTPRGRGG